LEIFLGIGALFGGLTELFVVRRLLWFRCHRA